MDEKQELLRKFLKRECNPDELRLLFKYLREDQASEYEQVMDEVWQEVQNCDPLATKASDDIYAAIQRRIRMDSPHSLSDSKRRHRLLTTASGAVAKIAAALAILVLGVWGCYVFVHSRQQTHETGFGAVATIQLPDRSMVTLNGNSRIRYQKEWDDDAVRQVWLEGEAFFSVTHTTDNRKFVVHTNNMDIEVLGTEFNVNNRRGATRITLSSGMVRLNGKGPAKQIKDVVMHPGEQASLNNRQTLELRKVDVKKITAWKDDVMIFDHTPVGEIAILIEETYGLAVALEGDSVADMMLTGALPANDISALLGMLKEVLDLDVVRKDQQVVISKRSNE